MQLPSLTVAVSASLPASEGVTMEATVTLECSSVHEMMVMENVPVNLAETVLPLGGFAENDGLGEFVFQSSQDNYTHRLNRRSIV